VEPRTCLVYATFVRRGQPVPGLVRFTPSRLWVVQDGIAWACLAPEVRLGPDGSFVARVTATDNDAIPWPYLISSPAGDYAVYVPWVGKGYALKELINDHRAGSRSPYR
jgi:hypothetical protein